MSKSDNLKDFVTDIADSLRTKKGTTEPINPQNFSKEILNLPVVGNEKFRAIVDRTITEVTAEDLQGVTSIGSNAFYRCMGLTSITVPNSVTSISRSAFEYCINLTSIIIPDTVTIIEPYVFANCTKLTSVTIPDSVTTIGEGAFVYCKDLTNLTIPNSVTSIGSNAIHIGLSTNKATIRMLSTTPPTIQSTTFDSTKLEKIIVPVGTAETYKGQTNWSSFADYIVEEVAA